jgi:transposase
MFKPKESSQSEYEFVSIDELVPDDHLLRLKYINFSLLLEKVRPYYSNVNGRPTDPFILFKMMFIGYIYGICSERQLEREIRTNVAYRLFLGLKFKDPDLITLRLAGIVNTVLRIQIFFRRFLMRLFFLQ